MISLYKITEELQPLLEEIELNGGEITDDQLQSLAIIESQLAIKVENYNWVIKSAEADVLMAKNEIERLKSFIKTKETLQDTLTDALLNATKMFGVENPKNNVKTLKVGTLTLSTRKTPDAVKLTQDEVLMDAKYKKYSISIKDLTLAQVTGLITGLKKANINYDSTTAISKTLIKEDLKNNIPVIGAELTSEIRLNIK
jgi:hypothetical protein